VDPLPYCIWAERELPDLGPSLFDLHCDPITADGIGHATTATAFVAAGSPLPTRQMVDARLVASFVDRFVDRHNAGSPLGGLRWLGPEVRAEDLPGFAGAAGSTDIQAYLEWSTRLLTIDPGDCTVDVGGRDTVVTCPHLTVTGPMLEGPRPQPTRFVLTGSMSRQAAIQPFDVILAVEPIGGGPLSLGATCRRMQRLAPESASLAFTADCRPIYSARAAEVLEALPGAL
jgi:hypothetical protein